MTNVIPLQSSNQPVFTILEIRPSLKPDSSIKAFADIQFQDVIIHGLKIIENKRGGYFVACPSNKWNNDKWFPVVEFKEPLQSEIAKRVLEEARKQSAIP